MYGIIAFKNGENAPSAEFRAEPGRYGRGSACKQCRISRSQRHRSSSNQSLEGNHKSVISPIIASPEQANSNSPLPDTTCSSLDLESFDEVPLTTSDPLELDFEGWVHNTSSETEFLRPDTDLVATSPHTESLGPLCFPSLRHEDSQENDKGFENSAPLLSDLVGGIVKNQSMVGRKPTTSTLLPDLQGMISDNRGQPSQCKCLQALTSSLSFLRSWTWGGQKGAEPGLRTTSMSLNCTEVEDFLALFEKSMAQLQAAEDCPLACILSQDLAILLSIILEQLAKLLLNLAADLVGEADESPFNISSGPTPHPTGVQEPTGNSTQQGQGIRPARIGTFEITDPLDLQMIMKLLLQIRTQALDAYIRRLSSRVKNYGFKDFGADLEKITEELSGAVFLENIRSLT
ncbi:hypothetical protein K449DRAFT_445456 [Hypoxylon sp. EC38]|nr:hypothetical protein K449DRAFT_445456 [Hypoxylon sp. EC38]